MKIKEGYILKKVAGSSVVVPVSTPHFQSIITLNDTGAFIFEFLKNETDVSALVKAVVNEYEVDEKTAEKDVETFMAALLKAGLIDE